MNTNIFSILVFILSSLSMSAQSVFAPVVGAEWQYSFTKEYVKSCTLPSRDAYDGLANYKYVKDTLVSNIICKKIEGVEIYKYRCGDTLRYTFNLAPLLIHQKNDSVFMLRENSFILIYLFPKVLNNEFKFQAYPNNSYPVKFIDTSRIFSIAFPNLSLKTQKFIVGQVSIVDVSFINPLIADRIGPLNADISLALSQFQGVQSLRKYQLNCYRDSEIGEFKLTQDCGKLRTSVSDLAFKKEYKVYNNGLKVVVEGNEGEIISEISVLSIDGRIIHHCTNINSDYFELNLNDVSKGIYFIQITNKEGFYISKKIFL